MPDLASYSLDDVLLFSPDVYFRLFELHNSALWPLQGPVFVVCLLVLLLLARATPNGMRASLAVFGAFWLWIAWSFFAQRYNTINWLAAYVMPLAALQGVALIGSALVWRNPLDAKVLTAAQRFGLGLYVLVLLGYPLLGLGFGRPWQGAELVGIAPDPSAVATLAILVMARGRWKGLLMVIPIGWCIATGLTLYALNAVEFMVAPLAVVLCVGASLVERWRMA
ncbi:MAG: hypothetical protein ACI9DC_000010 [Gammaproteobacteria bacterium]|jgi:hypothetical protein